MVTQEEFTHLAETYIDTVFRVAFNYLKSAADAEDITQNVFMKLLQTDISFKSEDHARFWLIRVTVNACKNVLRSKRWNQADFEVYAQQLTFETSGQSELFYSVMDLPEKYRVPIYLYYYEGYSTKEIGSLLHLPKNTVCTRLNRGRQLLRKTYEEGESHA